MTIPVKISHGTEGSESEHDLIVRDGDDVLAVVKAGESWVGHVWRGRTLTITETPSAAEEAEASADTGEAPRQRRRKPEPEPAPVEPTTGEDPAE